MQTRSEREKLIRELQLSVDDESKTKRLILDASKSASQNELKTSVAEAYIGITASNLEQTKLSYNDIEKKSFIGMTSTNVSDAEQAAKEAIAKLEK